MSAGSDALDEMMEPDLVPEGSEDRRYRYSRYTLAFQKPGVEKAYLAYRNPRIIEYLNWLLPIGAAMAFCGSIIDFTLLGSDQIWLLTEIRAAAAIGMLAAWWYVRSGRADRVLQKFLIIGAIAIHMIWLISVPIIGERITDYVGVLPINIMLTFLVSGLMYRWARWVALWATMAYAAALIWQHPSPVAPIIYMVVTGIYAGFAAFVAERARREAWAEAKLLDVEKARSDQLLLNVLPPSIATRMKDGEHLIADRFNDASVLFADIVGFTNMSSDMDPAELVKILDDIFRRFDAIAEELDLEKIKTIGDCYMMACGLPRERRCDHTRIAEAALRMQEALREIAADLDRDINIRVGIHCGPVVAGVIGMSKFIYDLWGDTVNVASRMESNAPVGAIQVSQAMSERLDDDFVITYRGEIELKGKGLQRAYLLMERKTHGGRSDEIGPGDGGLGGDRGRNRAGYVRRRDDRLGAGKTG